jgi:hypothetical protein
MNEYLYVTGGDPGTFFPGNAKDNRILNADVTLPLPKLEVNRATLLEAPDAQRFPWGTVVTVRAKAVNTPAIVSTITMLDFRKQVDFRNEVEKTATLKKEGVYFAFPFALERPRMKYQGATAWVDPETDMLPGANLQWFTTQAGVLGKSAGNAIAWATVDAPLITLQDINRGLWPESIQIRNGTVFSYAMNNYWYTDAPAQQGGTFTFRYALTSGSDVAEAQAMTLASEQRSSFTAIRHYNMGWDPTLADSGSGFLNVSPVGVSVLTIRPLPDADTFLVRVQNTLPDEVQAGLQFPAVDISDAFLATVLGERVSAAEWAPHQVTLPLKRYEIKSLVVKIKTREL